MRLMLALLVSLFLAACAATPDRAPVAAIGDTKVWYSIDNRAGLTPEELELLTGRLDEALAGALVPPGTAGARHAKVTITSYRMLHESGRALVGMVSGTDHVASVVQLSGPAGAAVDEHRVVTRASKAIGTEVELLHRHGNELAAGILAAD
jgi:hypothetical protein